MIIDNIPPEIAAPVIAILSVFALYKTYIEPGYQKDRENANR